MKIAKEIRESAAKFIAAYEMRANGLNRIACASARVTNIRISGNVVVANVTLQCGEGCPKERIVDVEYDIDKVGLKALLTA